MRRSRQHAVSSGGSGHAAVSVRRLELPGVVAYAAGRARGRRRVKGRGGNPPRGSGASQSAHTAAESARRGRAGGRQSRGGGRGSGRRAPGDVGGGLRGRRGRQEMRGCQTGRRTGGWRRPRVAPSPRTRASQPWRTPGRTARASDGWRPARRRTRGRGRASRARRGTCQQARWWDCAQAWRLRACAHALRRHAGASEDGGRAVVVARTSAACWAASCR